MNNWPVSSQNIPRGAMARFFRAEKLQRCGAGVKDVRFRRVVSSGVILDGSGSVG